MSDWEKNIRKERGYKNLADRIHTSKVEDMERLKNSGLPQYDFIKIPYLEFNKRNKTLMNFITKCSRLDYGFCIRALPNENGIKLGFTRKFKLGNMNYSDLKQFLYREVKEPFNVWDVGLSNWKSQIYGGTIILNERYAIVEMAKEEDGGVIAVTSGEVIPIIGRQNFTEGGSHSFGLKYTTEDETERSIILKALRCVKENPKTMSRGYFEFVVSEDEKIFFLDYKINLEYLR